MKAIGWLAAPVLSTATVIACTAVIACSTGSWVQKAWSAEPAAATPGRPALHRNSTYGCDFGYREQGAGCTLVRPPAHAYLNSIGEDWKCERGFHRAADTCVPVVVPKDGHLTDFGWECNRGFQRDGDSCTRITIPPHAFAIGDALESGWECERGYVQTDDRCLAVQVPPHAFLTSAGDAWECERGYMAQGNSCMRVIVPPRAYLSDDGHSWQCNRGFRAEGNGCVGIVLPRNAHLDSSGNAWECNWGFDAREGRCVADSPTQAAGVPRLTPSGYSRGHPPFDHGDFQGVIQNKA